MKHILEKNIGAIVAEDYRTAQVFKNHKIDFCCKGNRTISEVAKKNNLDADLLLRELEAINNPNTNEGVDFKTWPLDLLADYIEKKHHRYVEEKIPVLKQYLTKLCQVHGDRHTELFVINDQFSHAADELTMHMKKEELIVFPAIRKMMNDEKSGAKSSKFHFGSIENPIKVMMEEHEIEGDRFREIDALSNGYTPPEDACNTYRVAYSLLQEFEADLHQHIHLENNLLFPKAAALEATLFELS